MVEGAKHESDRMCFVSSNSHSAEYIYTHTCMVSIGQMHSSLASCRASNNMALVRQFTCKLFAEGAQKCGCN